MRFDKMKWAMIMIIVEILHFCQKIGRQENYFSRFGFYLSFKSSLVTVCITHILFDAIGAAAAISDAPND